MNLRKFEGLVRIIASNWWLLIVIDRTNKTSAWMFLLKDWGITCWLIFKIE
jgi:hypothetical protein